MLTKTEQIIREAMRAGAATTFGAATLSQKLGAIGRFNAALLGGGLLAMAGLQRGGLSGLGMTTAGGALIGFKFGGPLGAAIGAGIGAIAGTIRLFVKSAEDKAREKIKATYGVEIKDKGVLRQIVEMAKQGFGGNLDMAIRTPQVRDLIELYAMTTGQSTRSLPAKLSPISLVQAGGALFQQPGFSNGSPLSLFGGALPTIGLDRIGAGSAAWTSSRIGTLEQTHQLTGAAVSTSSGLGTLGRVQPIAETTTGASFGVGEIFLKKTLAGSTLGQPLRRRVFACDHDVAGVGDGAPGAAWPS